MKKVKENADKEDIGLCHRSQRRICSKKGKDIPIVKNRERGGIEICEGSVEERIYLTIKVTIDVTGIFSAEEE